MSDKSVILVGVLLLFCSVTCGPVRDRNITTFDLKKFDELTTRLSYGNFCSYQAERMRLRLTQSMTETPQNNTAIMDIIFDIQKTGEPLCNANQLLSCNKLTETCDCGEPYPKSNDIQTQKYTVEDGICRWTKKSGCVGEEIQKQGLARFRPGQNMKIESKCQNGTECVTHTDGKECNVLNLIQELHETNQIFPGVSTNDIFDSIYKRRSCACDVVLSNSTNENDHIPTGRAKRDARMDFQYAATIGLLPHFTYLTSNED